MNTAEQTQQAKWLTLIAMCFGMFLVQLDLTIVNVALPKIGGTFGGGVAGLQWIVDGYAVVFASLLLTAGGLGDLVGRRRIFMFGLAIFGLGSALCALTPSLGMLIAGRVVQGIGATLELPGSLSILTVTFDDPKERAHALGLWSSVAGLGMIVGPVAGGVLVDSFGWESIFWINLPIAALALGITWRFVAESSNPEGRRLDLWGQLLSALCLGAAVFAIIQGNSFGWTSPLILGLFGVALVGGATFVLHERHSDDPLLQIGFFHDRVFAGANIVAVLVVFSIYATLFVVSLFLQNVQGYSAIGAGLRLLPMTATFILTSPLGGRLTGRFGARLPITMGMAVSGVGLLLLSRVDASTSYITLSAIFALTGAAVGLIQPAMIAAAMGAVPPARSGMASGVINTSRQTGGAIGNAVLPALLATAATSKLGSAIAGLGLSPDTRDHLLGLAGRGGRVGSIPLPAGVDRVALQRAVDSAFVSGMHLAFLVGGLALLSGALAGALLVQQTRRDEMPSGASDAASIQAPSEAPLSRISIGNHHD